MPSYTIDNYTSTSVTLEATGLTVGTVCRFFVRLSSNYSDVSGDAFVNVTSSTMRYTFTGLQPGTSYTCNVGYNFDGTGVTWIGGKTFTTKAASTRPWNWGWYSTIVKGGAVGLSALEWNHFCERINQFRLYKDLSTYYFTPVISGATPIKAVIVNEAWDAINEIPGHGTMPSKAYTNGPLYASFFTGLTEALNAIE